ncbi:MAG: SDR family NAD(P)-dependent oxidoreductase [Anaerolineaceae bacterium]|nr:SDR family NAD(P)-dependent oxidoreductase [Anaerolineaceae bacterium]
MPPKWTTQNIPDMNSKVVIVTGANSGVGYEAAKELARKGAQTILACRSLDKARAALSQIQTEIPGAAAEVLPLDLTSLDSVRQFAAAFKAKYTRLDVLLNNAGIMMVPYGKTADGFERQFGTNHLGHFALTGLLLDLLLATPGARVVNVSSNAHKRGDLDFDNLMFEGGAGYDPTRAYGRSKLANLLFTYELQRRLTAAASSTLAVAAHPGVSRTNLTHYLTERSWLIKLGTAVFIRTLQSAAMGALPLLRAAVDPQVIGGQYYGPKGPGETRGYPVVVQSTRASHDEEAARRLWQVSAELTGVHYL